VGYVVGEGTQHAPQKQFGTLMLRGDLKQMKPRYLRGATIHGYGTTLYVGVGISIPILNYNVAKTAAASDAEIFTDILDYGVPSRERPVVSHVSYENLKSGQVSTPHRWCVLYRSLLSCEGTNSFSAFTSGVVQALYSIALTIAQASSMLVITGMFDSTANLRIVYSS